LRNDLGNATALFGLAIAIVAGVASSSFVTGFVIAAVSVGLGMWIAYGW
jgi:hypothetical protein